MIIPIEIIQYIDSFICEKNKKYINLSIISKPFNNYKYKCKCNISKYKNLIGCSYHDDIYLVNTIYKLNYARKYKKNTITKYNTNDSLYNDNRLAIHFINNKSLKIAEPYLKDFGLISHYCCNNTGVMYY